MVKVLLLIIVVLLLIYTYYLWQIKKLWTPKVGGNNLHIDQCKASILIACRNEEKNIANCIDSILKNQVNENISWKIIVIDDNSTDKTIEILNQYPSVQIIQSEQGQGKKYAISQGVQHADGDYILITDADCEVGPQWINSRIHHMQREKSAIATSMVFVKRECSILSEFEHLDFCSLMSATNYGIKSKSFYLGNGANLAFEKSAFQNVRGFSNNLNFASGDDVFLINKINANGGKVTFDDQINSLVLTQSNTTIKDLLHQRKRWATKTGAYATIGLIRLQATVFIICLLIGILFLLSFSWFEVFMVFILLSVSKIVIDALFLKIISKYIGEKIKWKLFVPSFFLHAFMMVYMGIHGILPSKYDWKGRKLK